MVRPVKLFKRGWDEIPEIVAATFMGLVGISLSVAGLLIYKEKDGDFNKYRFEYTVIRDDDPLANRFHKVNRPEYD